MQFVKDDGGRAAAGFKGDTGDCVVRAVAIATGRPYPDVYRELSELQRRQRRGKRPLKGASSVRNGTYTKRKWFRDYMAGLGWRFVPTMGIGTGCTVHLVDGELPMGRLIVSLSKHYAAVLDGVVHDTYDPQRSVHYVRSGGGGAGGPDELQPGEWRNANGICGISHRCVYGYWVEAAKAPEPMPPLDEDLPPGQHPVDVDPGEEAAGHADGLDAARVEAIQFAGKLASLTLAVGLVHDELLRRKEWELAQQLLELFKLPEELQLLLVDKIREPGLCSGQ